MKRVGDWTLAFISVTILLAGFVYPGLITQIEFSDLESLHHSISEVPYHAGIVLVFLQILQSLVIVVPLSPITIVGGWIFGSLGGFLISWLGVFLGQTLCFSLSRRFGTRFIDWVATEGIKRRVQALSERGISLKFAFVLYLTSMVSFDILSVGLGLLRTGIRKSLLIIVIGIAPKIFVLSFLGDELSPAKLNYYFLLIVAVIVVVVVVSSWAAKRMIKEP